MIKIITAPDFSKKQIIVVFFNEGEKLSLSNSNLIVKDKSEKIKLQCTCYRIFIVFGIGHCSITSALIQAAKKFGFFIALMTPGFRLYSIIGAEKDSNFLLHKKQYNYECIDLAKHITKNKINNQKLELKSVRNKNDLICDAIEKLTNYMECIDNATSVNEIMAYEGLSSKLYFKNHFNNVLWNGRQPRIKKDYINSTLDIGYTLLFTFIDALVSSYGFDTYCGVLHKQFYMRKSLVCDFVEPFRPIIDHTIKKGINLKQIKPEDFIINNNQYRLLWKESPRYTELLLKPLLTHKDDIFQYIQSYYRAFMKDLPSSEFPIYNLTEE